MDAVGIKAPAGGRPHARSGGRWLVFARAVWLGMTALSYGLFAIIETLRTSRVSLWLREPVGGTQARTARNGGGTREHGPEAGPQTEGGEA